MADRDVDEGRKQHGDPDGLGDHLQLADHRHAHEGDGNDDERRDDVTQHQRHIRKKLQRLRHDRAFEREKDEGEGRIDQRRDGGADIAEPRPAREQIHVDVIAARIVGDGQVCDEDEQAGDEHGGKRIGEPVAERDRPADCLQSQK